MIINALSMFSSAGIAETYFEKHNINVKVATEILKDRCDFYKKMYPDTKVICGDITNKGIFNKVYSEAKKEKCNMILATPPCQGMSTAGLQKENDPRNKLIIQTVEMIEKLKPDFAIIENVPEILRTKIEIKKKKILIDDFIKERLSDIYNFNENKIVNAMYYGVAQSRERCIYLLINKKYKKQWEFPKSNNKITTLRDAIGDLPSLDPEITDISNEELLRIFPDFEKKRKSGLNVSVWHCPPRHKLRHVIAMMHTPEGHSAWENKEFYPKLANGSKSKGFKNTYKRQWWDKPAYTVTKYTSRIGSQENGHPGYHINKFDDEKRRLWSDARTMTIFELMRVSSLPDDWKIPSGTSSNFLREIIGEGIPPKLIEKAIGELIKIING